MAINEKNMKKFASFMDKEIMPIIGSTPEKLEDFRKYVEIRRKDVEEKKKKRNQFKKT